jgi:hypothetical protein
LDTGVPIAYNATSVKFPHTCNPLILRASAAPKRIENHSKSMFSTIVSTIKTRKEEVAEEVETAFLPRNLCILRVLNVSCVR